MKQAPPLPDDPRWYKDAIIYEARVRSFYDSNGDGIGDFRGMAEKLDYIHDLGVTAIWLLPFYPSPLKDDGYDISDYRSVHPEVGTLADFKLLLREAHRRGLRVITELVLNHTSDQHQWFQRARHARPGSAARDFYTWSDTPEKYKGTRIIFQDYEPSNWAWDQVAQAYVWHRFYSSQPDLNYDNPRVRREMLRVLEYWLKMGVDGLRLDAVPYLFEREGTNNENLPETHDYLREVRREVDRKFKNRMLLAEANQWPEDAVAYFGEGDECHMAFHFPIMPRMFMALQMEDRYPIIDILNETPPIPESSQWALFLRNHDELTLEMVTDEERDYMYRTYAMDPQARINLGIRRRLAPLLGNNRRKIELMNGLLFALPGTPIIYYGDEIGMGDNFYLGDRNGVRTPMQWSPDRNAGFSKANPQLLYLPVINDPEYHYETVNVETQLKNANSLLWWTRRLIALRKRYSAFGRGDIKFLTPSNPKVLAFIRSYEDQRILVVANLSRFVQYAELDLAEYSGMVPEELFGHTPFPQIGDLPYLLTLGPHNFYWFALNSSPAQAAARRVRETLPAITLTSEWPKGIRGRLQADLEQILPDYLQRQRWFRPGQRAIRNASPTDSVAIEYGEAVGHLTLVQVDYNQGDPETYLLPLAVAGGRRATDLKKWSPAAVVAELRGPGDTRPNGQVLYDAMVEPSFCRALLELVPSKRKRGGRAGRLVGVAGRALRDVLEQPMRLQPQMLHADERNTTVVFGDGVALKLFRRLASGENPALEVSRFLTNQARFAHTPRLIGHLDYRPAQAEPVNLAILHEFVPNEGDVLRFTRDELSRFYERVETHSALQAETSGQDASPTTLAAMEPPLEAAELIGGYLETARLLGQRTADLHLALATGTEPAFAPEEFTQLYQRSLYQSFRSEATRVLGLLRERLADLPVPRRAEARQVLEAERTIGQIFRRVVGPPMLAMRTRTHGNYHLAQILHTGRDFAIIDFQGDAQRAMGERRIKRSPLRDVASMLRSFEYAAQTELREHVDGDPHFDLLEPWARSWTRWVRGAFLAAYLETAAAGDFLPRRDEEVDLLLTIYMLDKAFNELRHELQHRPEWVDVPMKGILALLEGFQAER